MPLIPSCVKIFCLSEFVPKINPFVEISVAIKFLILFSLVSLLYGKFASELKYSPITLSPRNIIKILKDN